MILYPDNYTLQTGATSYTSTQWATMEKNYCVFLPAAGYRNGSDVSSVGSIGCYWSSTDNGESNAYRVYFKGGSGSLVRRGGRTSGSSVRLITESK